MKLSELNPSEQIKLLVYGDSGSGKTCFATDFPGPVFVADFDNKISSAASYYSDDAEKLTGIEYESYFPQGPDYRAGADMFNKWALKLAELEKLSKAGDFPFKTIVIDSLTLYTDRLLEKIMADNPGTKRGTAGVPALQDYGNMNIKFKQQLCRALVLPCNVVVTAHIKTDKNDLTGELIRGPSITPKLASWLPIVFGEVYRSFTKREGAETRYFAQTQSDHYFSCRSQIKGLKDVVPLKHQSLVGV